METSTRFALDKENLRKIGKGAAMALAGALLTYLADLLPQIDFGAWTPLVAAGFSVLANSAHKFLTDYSSNQIPKNG